MAVSALSDSAEDTVALLRFAPQLQIAHHIAGRVRLKLAAGAMAEAAFTLADIRRLLAALEATPGIKEVSFNPLARSCVIAYDPKIWDQAVWPELVGGTRSAAVTALAAAVGDRMRG